MQRFFMMVLVWCVLAANAARAEDWGGLFVEGQLGYALGDHALSYRGYEIDDEAYTFGVSGGTAGAAVGYRYQFADVPVVLGIQFSALQSNLAGVEMYTESGTQGVVHFSEDRLYLLALQLGYVFRDDWLLYASYGASGGKM